jgi:hypothetical protein
LNPGLPWQKQLSKRGRIFIRKLDLNLRNKLMKFYICSLALYDVQTCTLWKVDQKYFESFEIWPLKMKQDYTEPRKKGAPYIKKK